MGTTMTEMTHRLPWLAIPKALSNLKDCIKAMIALYYFANKNDEIISMLMLLAVAQVFTMTREHFQEYSQVPRRLGQGQVNVKCEL